MNTEFLSALEDLAREKNIDINVLIEALEAALLSAYKRNFSSRHTARVVVDRENGEFKVLAQRAIVEEVTDPRIEISLQDAQAINPNYELDDVIENEVTPRDFGRIAAQTAKQVIIQRIREAERSVIYDQYAEREGDIITGVVNLDEPKGVYIDLGKTEAFMSVNDRIPGETFKIGDRVKAYICEVKKTNKGPQILVSRTHSGLLGKLFELEVPELVSGVVELKAVSREAGSRSKIAVFSKLANVDPVGACVGTKGMRVQAIVNELNGEKIDVIKWSEDIERFIANSLSPAKVIKVFISKNDRSSLVIVPDSQSSLAIGKEGQNARLAAKLTGWKIDVKSKAKINADNTIRADLEAHFPELIDFMENDQEYGNDNADNYQYNDNAAEYNDDYSDKYVDDYNGDYIGDYDEAAANYYTGGADEYDGEEENAGGAYPEEMPSAPEEPEDN